MNNYNDLDTLYSFLESISSIEEFFSRKEPGLDDEVSRQFAALQIEEGVDPDIVLGALKANERQVFAKTLKQRQRPN